MENKYDSLKLKNQFCFSIYLCSKELINKYTPLLEEINLTYTQFIVMMYFWEYKISNVKNISRALLLDSSTLTPLLKKLELKGYIVRSRSTRDERNLNMTVTEKGMMLREKALVIREQMSKYINISNEEAKTLYELIYKVLINTQKRRWSKCQLSM